MQQLLLAVLLACSVAACAHRSEAAAPTRDPSSSSPVASGKHPPCELGRDQACNADPSVSALWGRCTELGVCECHEGFELDPVSARCRPRP